jgi:hypothetical protein
MYVSFSQKWLELQQTFISTYAKLNGGGDDGIASSKEILKIEGSHPCFPSLKHKNRLGGRCERMMVNSIGR